MEKSKKGKDNKKGGGDKKNAKEDKGGDDKLKTCNFVKARHILCEKLSQIEEIIFDFFNLISNHRFIDQINFQSLNKFKYLKNDDKKKRVIRKLYYINSPSSLICT